MLTQHVPSLPLFSYRVLNRVQLVRDEDEYGEPKTIRRSKPTPSKTAQLMSSGGTTSQMTMESVTASAWARTPFFLTFVKYSDIELTTCYT